MVLWLSLAGGAQRTQISQEEMKQWLTYIASDALQGRQVFTEGLGLAGAYIADQLKSFGVAPGGDSGTYFQAVKVLGMRTRSNSSVTVTANGQTRTFKDGQGVTFPRNQGGKQTIDAAVEFVGYGLQFAPLKHDDYARRDMKGKIALFIGRGIRGMTAAHNRLINARARDAVERERAVASIGPVAPAGRGRGAGPGGALLPPAVLLLAPPVPLLPPAVPLLPPAMAVATPRRPLAVPQPHLLRPRRIRRSERISRRPATSACRCRRRSPPPTSSSSSSSPAPATPTRP